MNDAKKISCFLVLSLFVVGCGPHIPTSEYPVEVQKAFHVPFDNVWDSSLDVIETFDGTIIAKDKSSGLITCKFSADKSQSKTYINIYIRRDLQNSISNVYIIPYTSSIYTAMRLQEQGIILQFEDFSFRKDYFSEISKTFFEKLRGRLEQSES